MLRNNTSIQFGVLLKLCVNQKTRAITLRDHSNTLHQNIVLVCNASLGHAHQTFTIAPMYI